MDLAHLSLHLPKNSTGLLYSALSPFKPKMPSVSLDFISYQPPHSNARSVRGRSAVGKRGPPTASSEHNDSVALAPKTTVSADVEDYDLNE